MPTPMLKSSRTRICKAIACRKFQLNVKNLFDRTYYSSAASRYFVSMGDSRQVVVATTLEF
jgi:outer membrane receptor for ferric coprogen and ferric-rhodotorulic acid